MRERFMHTTDQIPVIDMQGLDDDPAVLEALDDACRSWGFFQLLGHGVPAELMARTYEQMRAFFALPVEAKHAIERTADNAWGFYDKELTKNQRDWKQIFDLGPDSDEGPLAGNRAQWPGELPGFRPVMEALYAACEALSFRLLGGIMRCLGMPTTYLHGAFTPAHTSFLRLNYYPACHQPAAPDAPLGAAGNFGIHHHTDAGALTVLLADDQPGLQVYRHGRWTIVEPRPGALIINIGAIVQVWSNDRYQAALHRVLASRDADRYSAPFFFNPAYDVSYEPLPGVCSDANPPHYRPINWGEFRAGRAAGDYANQGEEIQIAHFRVR
jgi:isopenicillin N synthase-like dioxygenase